MRRWRAIDCPTGRIILDKSLVDNKSLSLLSEKGLSAPTLSTPQLLPPFSPSLSPSSPSFPLRALNFSYLVPSSCSSLLPFLRPQVAYPFPPSSSLNPFPSLPSPIRSLLPHAASHSRQCSRPHHRGRPQTLLRRRTRSSPQDREETRRTRTCGLASRKRLCLGGKASERRQLCSHNGEIYRGEGLDTVESKVCN